MSARITTKQVRGAVAALLVAACGPSGPDDDPTRATTADTGVTTACPDGCPLDGNLLVWAVPYDQSTTEAFQSIHLRVLSQDGRTRTRIEGSGRDTWVPWSASVSPDGLTIALSEVDLVAIGDPASEVWLVDADGQNARLLAVDASDPTWMPDGSALIYQVASQGQLVRHDLASGHVEELTAKSPDDGAWWPHVSPDGSEVLYTTGSVVRARSLLGPGDRALTDEGDHFAKFYPSWSPDGSHVAYVKADGNVDLWLRTMRADGTGDVAISSALDHVSGPAWFPDGSRIAWNLPVAPLEARAAVHTALDGGDMRRLLLDDPEFQLRMLPQGWHRGAPRELAEPDQVEVLVNGGGDSCTMEGWVGDAGIVGAVSTQDQGTAPAVTPWSGACFFSLALAPASEALLAQTGGAPAGSMLLLSGRFQTLSDTGQVTLVALDDNGVTLARAETRVLSSSEWAPFQLALQMPDTASSWGIEAYGSLDVGSYVNVFFDDLELLAVAP